MSVMGLITSGQTRGRYAIGWRPHTMRWSAGARRARRCPRRTCRVVAQFGGSRRRPDHLDPPVVSRAAVQERLANHPLAGAIERMRQLFADAVTDPHLIMGLVDPDGLIIHRCVPADLLPIADGIGLVDGSRWDEASVGTNAITLVMQTGRPQLVYGPSTTAGPCTTSTAPPHPSTTGPPDRSSA